MKYMQKKIGVLMLTGMASIGVVEKSLAEYYIAAFDNGDAFEQLLEKDSKAAQSVLSKNGVSQQDYADLNNLCISQILSTDYVVAIDSCEKAISMVPGRSVHNTRLQKSQIYTNLAVAKALAGDTGGAMADLKTSLSINKRNKNASKNYDLLASFELAD